jgi:2-oxoglutarate ferredoxin oxidoreductase subunit gamma
MNLILFMPVFTRQTATSFRGCRYTTMLISHGTETRGGYVRSQVVISDEFIDSPVVERPDFFCAFSGIAYSMFKGLCGSQSLILHNPDIVSADPALASHHWGIKAETVATEELGDAVFANVILLGALSSRLALLSPGHISEAILGNVCRNASMKRIYRHLNWGGDSLTSS